MYAAAAVDRKPFTPELKKYADPVTEFPVFRLTDPTIECRFPAPYNRFVNRRGNSLLYTRAGEAVCRVDVKTGLSTEIAPAAGIDPLSLSMVPDERTAFWTESGKRLIQCVLGSGRKRTVYECPEGWSLGTGASVSEDGLFVALIERREAAHRIRLITTVRGNATTVLDAPDFALQDPIIRPRRAGILYRRPDARELWVTSFDASQNVKLKTPVGEVWSAHWSADGRTVEYLARVEGAKLPVVRECVADPNDDKLVAPTSQFAVVSRNGDASVFVGASTSKASPVVLLLLRTTKREFTLAEHKASDPALVNPVFSANSQRVFFQTDRDGKWAIYYMQVEKLVEETEN
jgi:oligogalacturonide lyase